MERDPRSVGEAYGGPVIPEEGKVPQYDVDVRYEIEPGAATATQFVLASHMLPERLMPYAGSFDEAAKDKVFQRWTERYAEFFGQMCKELPVFGELPDLVAHIQNQDIVEALQGNTTLSHEELREMAAFLEQKANDAKKTPLFSEEEMIEIAKKYAH